MRAVTKTSLHLALIAGYILVAAGLISYAKDQSVSASAVTFKSRGK